jgi:PhoH-like ATPase
MIAIIDTNVIADDPFFFNKLKYTKIVLPMTVLEELDKIKSYDGLVGKNCRTFIHNLRSIMENQNKQDTNTFHFAKDMQKDKVNDNTIINTAIRISKNNPRVILYTNDINMQIKAKLLKVDATSFIFAPEESVYEQSYLDYELTLENLKEVEAGYEVSTGTDTLRPNQYLLLNKKVPAKHLNGKITRLVSIEDGIMGLTSNNLEQTFALDALINDKIKLVSLLGSAGTGKTLLAIASALYKTLDESKYDGIIIARPVVPMGKDIGFLPGDMNEKLLPWAQPFFDNIDFLMGEHGKQGTAQELIYNGIIKLESISHIRGRSFNKKFIIIDEAQNLDKHELKTLITRVGIGTKIVLTGDVNQIDTKHIDISNNGLTYVTEQFLNEAISANVTLMKSERSELAGLACKLL